MPEIRVGDRCVVTHDMGSAFRVGDPLLVEEISPVSKVEVPVTDLR